MFYEVRTYKAQSGSLEGFLKLREKRHPIRLKHCTVSAIWTTEFGTLNQLIQVWQWRDLNERTLALANAKADPEMQVGGNDSSIVSQETEIMVPTSFMCPLSDQNYGDGNIYEMCIDTYYPRTIPKVIEAWEESIERRTQLSPLVACWYSAIGALNKIQHIWVYRNLEERSRVRQEALSDSHWPPKSDVLPVHEENKLLIPVSYSLLQ